MKPSRPIKDLLANGIIDNSVLDFKCGKRQDMDYVISQKPNTIATGYDPVLSPHIPRHKFDTVIYNYGINYLATKDEIINTLRKAISKLNRNGKLIIIARSVAEVRGNVKRNANWTLQDDGGYLSDNGVYQRGYDSYELELFVKELGMNVISNDFQLGTVPYTYVIAEFDK